MDIAAMINEELVAKFAPTDDDATRAVHQAMAELAALAEPITGEPPAPPAEPVCRCEHCGKRIAFETCYRNQRGQLFCNSAEWKAFQHGSAGTVAKGALPQANRHHRRRIAAGRKG